MSTDTMSHPEADVKPAVTVTLSRPVGKPTVTIDIPADPPRRPEPFRDRFLGDSDKRRRVVAGRAGLDPAFLLSLVGELDAATPEGGSQRASRPLPGPRTDPTPEAAKGAATPEASVYDALGGRPLTTAQRDALTPAQTEGAAVVFTVRPVACRADGPQARHLFAGPGEAERVFRAALAVDDLPENAEPLIEIRAADRDGGDAAAHVALVDIDTHNVDPADAEWCKLLDADEQRWRAVAGWTAVRPRLSWRTHGRGYRGVFFAACGLRADELAALFLVEVAEAGGLVGTTVDSVTRTRHPGYPRADADGVKPPCTVESGYRNEAGRVVRRLTSVHGDPDPAAVEDYLEDKGWAIGDQLPHDECPIGPGHESKFPKPVCVNENGVQCFSCAGRGAALGGCSKAGFVPWGALLDGGTGDGTGRTRTPFGDMVRNKTHWDHASIVLASELPRLPESFRRLAYRAALRLVHVIEKYPAWEPGSAAAREAAESLVAAAFRPVPWVRGVGGCFVSAADLSTPLTAKPELALSALPFCKGVCVDGKAGTAKVVPDGVRLASLLNGGDLTADGYPPVRALIGADMRDPKVVSAGDYAKVVPVPLQRRSASPLAYAAARAWWPKNVGGVDMALVEMLLAAKAFAQNRHSSEPLIVFLSGPSGSGKTYATHLAASIACDMATVIPAEKRTDPAQLQRAVNESFARGTYCFLDEFSKYNLTEAETLSFILGLRRGVTFHAMYKGTQVRDALGVVVIADTAIPDVFVRDQQLARRVVHVPVGAGLTAVPESSRGVRDGGGGMVGGERVRLLAEDALQCGGGGYPLAAFDGILTGVAARCRRVAADAERIDVSGDNRSFARSLGFSVIADGGGDGVDRNAALRELFDLATALDDTRDHTFKGEGWKVFNLHSETPVAEHWREHFENSRQTVTAADWGDILEVPGAEMSPPKTHGRKLGLRWHHGDPRKPGAVYNRDILAHVQTTA